MTLYGDFIESLGINAQSPSFFSVKKKPSHGGNVDGLMKSSFRPH